MFKKLGISVAALALVLAAQTAVAKTKLQLLEVITSPERTALLQGQLAKFQAANPDIEIEVVSLPWDTAFEKARLMIEGGQVPDVMEMPERWAGLYIARDQVEDVSGRLGSSTELKTLQDSVTRAGSFGQDGKLFEVPYGFYLRAMFYNKKLFAEAGAQPPKTIQEFYDAAMKVSALGNGKYGYCLRGGKGGFNGWVTFMMTTAGQNQWFHEDGTSTLADPEMVKGAQMLVDLYQKGGAPKDSVNWAYNEIVSGFYSGTCAMLDQDPDALIGIKDKMPAEDFGVIPMPTGPSGKGYPTLGFAGWSMMSASQHKDEAWKLISFLSAPEQNLEWAKFVGVLPIHEGADKDPYFQGENFAGWFEELANPDTYVGTMPPIHLKDLGILYDKVSVSTGQEMLLGKRPVAEVIKQWSDMLTESQKKWLAENP
jgi:multiple sugar transport system substrate-binding protein